MFIKQLRLGIEPDLRKYSIKHISDNGNTTIVTIETDTEMTDIEIKSILEEIRMNLQVYLLHK